MFGMETASGLTTFTGADSLKHLYTTNVGDGVAKGIESYVSVSLLKLSNITLKGNDIRVFNSLSYTHARYKNTSLTRAE